MGTAGVSPERKTQSGREKVCKVGSGKELKVPEEALEPESVSLYLRGPSYHRQDENLCLSDPGADWGIRAWSLVGRFESG